ncbi:unnamed protein product [Urochloa decumbens]|uniref:Uncharacterized protein n=1 Tax=Urochloa decumbens TaxID=240449 RepID=A0ABC9G4A1_9POAL
MAAAADLRPASEDGQRKCRLFQCFCCWSRCCSPGIPRIGPRSEYSPADTSAPYGLDLRSGEEEEEEEEGTPPLWSVLVGCTSADHPSHNLRIHQFRVTGTGRVIGHNNDHLELFCGVSPIDDNKHTVFPVARAATVAADGNLYIICEHMPAIGSSGQQQADEEKVFHPKAFSLNTADKDLSTLPPLPFTRGSWEAISACGKLWVPLVLVKTGSYRGTWRLIVYELNGDCWLETNSVEFPYKPSLERGYRGVSLQGYVVLDSRFILLSCSDSIFFLFECASGELSRVVTDGRRQYIPITGKAVHVKRDEMIYFIRGTQLFAYKNLPKSGEPLATPIEIATIWPYDKEGCGSMVHLGGRMLCAVWINMRQSCGCATRHALITTLRVTGIADESGCFVPNGVHVLHSTCRQIDMLRCNAPGYTYYDTFCFLQKCQDPGAKFDPSDDLSEMGGFYCPQVEKFSEMPTCCREFLNGKPEPGSGVIALDSCKMATRSDFYFICQADQCSLLYQISTSGGKLTCSDKALKAVLHLDTVRFRDVGANDPPEWYFVHRGSTLDVIPSSPDCNHYVVDVERKSYRLYNSKRSKLFFSAVFRAGQYVVALCDTLQYVYVLRNNFQWRRQKTASRSVDVSQKVKVSGFVDLIDDKFMISDFDTDESFLFDLKRWEWFSVSPSFGLLSGRCIFTEGFVYTCSNNGLYAYELTCDDTSYSLDVPIMLDFSWKYICGNRRFLSFDSICKGEIDDSIVFCVVYGHETEPPSTSHTLATTTVQVKLLETALGTKMPVRLDHVDISVSSIVQKGWILTNYAFSV